MKILNFLIGLFVRELEMHMAVPRGFAVAWQVPHARRVIAMPLGLNVVAATARRALLWVRYFGVQPLNQMPAYHAGLLAGRRAAVSEYVSAFEHLIACTSRYQQVAQYAITRAEERGSAVTFHSDPELWADLQHARSRADCALTIARERLRSVQAKAQLSY